MGGSFNVRSRDEQISIACKTGGVSVAHAYSEATLRQGMVKLSTIHRWPHHFKLVRIKLGASNEEFCISMKRITNLFLMS